MILFEAKSLTADTHSRSDEDVAITVYCLCVQNRTDKEKLLYPFTKCPLDTLYVTYYTVYIHSDTYIFEVQQIRPTSGKKAFELFWILNLVCRVSVLCLNFCVHFFLDDYRNKRARNARSFLRFLFNNVFYRKSVGFDKYANLRNRKSHTKLKEYVTKVWSEYAFKAEK